ncbi:MAG: hypothetical protein H7X80_03190, partial [bacterium]|nr:hypothetical protein [Candidatus Kapabacteria bacterium]
CSRADGVADTRTPFAFDELYRIAVQLESLFGGALDIEWVSRESSVSIVQCRPITVSAERRVHWSNTNVNENYPGPITPLLYSIARDAYYNYFKNLARLLQVPRDAISDLEPDFANIIGAFGCRMYYNMTSIHNVIARSPFAKLLRGAFDNFVGYAQGDVSAQGKRRARNVVRFASSFIALNYRLPDNVRAFEARADAYAREYTAALELPALRASFHQFIEIRMHGWYRASLADFFAMVHHGLLGAYCRRYFADDASGVHNTLVQAIPGLVSSKPVAEIWRIAQMIRADERTLEVLRSCTSTEVLLYLRGERMAHSPTTRAIDDYLETWGFRCSGELMLTVDAYCDAPERFIDLLRGYVDQPGPDPDITINAKAEERRNFTRSLRRVLVRKRGLLAPLAFVDIAAMHILVRLCIGGIASRERVRLKQALLYHRFKIVLKRIGAQLVSADVIDNADDIMYLRHEEIAELLAMSQLLPGATREIVSARRIEFSLASTKVYPDDFSTAAGAQ